MKDYYNESVYPGRESKPLRIQSTGNTFYPEGLSYTHYEQGLTKLELFTLTAMKSLCNDPKRIADDGYATSIAIKAVKIAKATLNAINLESTENGNLPHTAE